jgi:hypothetical protein
MEDAIAELVVVDARIIVALIVPPIACDLSNALILSICGKLINNGIGAF